MAIAADRRNFKECSLCGQSWGSLTEFVLDRELDVCGYQACFTKPERGLILLTHCREGCGTTLAVVATELRALYDGPEYTQRRAGQERCRSYCLRHNIIEECDVDCDMAWVRVVLQYLRRHELPAHAAHGE